MENMFIVISQLNPDPLYKQVTDQIKSAIAKGVLAPNMKLPSIRKMADELNISAITIKRAYADLESEGYIMTRSGMGSFIADINRDKLRNEKLTEIKIDLQKMIRSSAKFEITAENIKSMIDTISDSENNN